MVSHVITRNLSHTGCCCCCCCWWWWWWWCSWWCCCCCRCCCRRSPVLVNIFLVQDMHICAGRKKTSSSANARLFFVSNMLLKDPLCYIYRDVGFLTWGTPNIYGKPQIWSNLDDWGVPPCLKHPQVRPGSHALVLSTMAAGATEVWPQKVTPGWGSVMLA